MNLCISSCLAVVWLTSRIPNQIKRNGYIDFIFTARSSLFIIFIVTIYVYFWLSLILLNVLFLIQKNLYQMYWTISDLPKLMGPGFRQCLPCKHCQGPIAVIRLGALSPCSYQTSWFTHSLNSLI